MMNPENPLALIAQRFAFFYVRHYTGQPLFDEKTEDFYMIKSPTLNNELSYLSLE
jgi:hypothetical protein